MLHETENKECKYVELLESEINSCEQIRDTQSESLSRFIQFEDIIGCGFVLQIENLREKTVGVLTIVTKKMSCVDSSKICQLIFLICITLYATAYILLGPLSALLVLLGWFLCSFSFQDVNALPATQYENISSYAQFFFPSCILSIIIYFSQVGFVPHSCPIIGSTLSIGLLTTHILLSRSKFDISFSSTVQYPFVIYYEDEEVAELLTLRKKFFQIPELRSLISEVWIGGPQVEAILSYILPAYVYNSRRIRHYVHIIMDYMIPMYTVLRGLGALVPQLEIVFTYLMVRTRKDIGLGLIWYMALYHGRFISTQMGYINHNLKLIIEPLTYIISYFKINMNHQLLMNIIMNSISKFNMSNIPLIPYQYMTNLIQQIILSMKVNLFILLIFKFILINHIILIFVIIIIIIQVISIPLWNALFTIINPAFQAALQIQLFFFTVLRIIQSIYQSLRIVLSLSLTYITSSFFTAFQLISTVLLSLWKVCTSYLMQPLPVPNLAQVYEILIVSYFIYVLRLLSNDMILFHN